MKSIKYFTVLTILYTTITFSQKSLRLNDVRKHTKYFTVSKSFQFSENILPILNEEAKNSQFIGLAEVHQSEQLSFFTTAFLSVLKIKSSELKIVNPK